MTATIPRSHGTPEIWDEQWKNYSDFDFDRELAKEELSLRWKLMEAKINQQFGSFKDLKIVEVGAGRGLVTLLMIRRGAKGTVLDYSKDALQTAQKFYDAYKIDITPVLQDVRTLSPDLLGQFNVSMSFGLVEHFQGPARESVIKAHHDLLKPGGVSFISVPNTACAPYRLFKSIAEMSGIWKVGLEIPFSRKELMDLSQKAGYRSVDIFGSSFVNSVKTYLFADPLSFASRKTLKRDLFENLKLSPDLRGSSFRRRYVNDHFGYALTLVGERATVQGHR